jgi:small subunit ribosomal protein S15e
MKWGADSGAETTGTDDFECICICREHADNAARRSLLDLHTNELPGVVHARARRRLKRGLKRKPMGLIKKLRKAKQEAKPNEKPDLVKTHLRDMIVVPEMIGSVIGIYSGKEFNQVEIKPEMVGHYLGEFSIS